MASLTITTYYTRKAIKYGAISFAALLILKSVLSTAIGIWRTLNPPPPPAPKAAFGKLPKVEFPESEFTGKGLIYQLETVGGGTPNLGDRANVYFIPAKKPGLLALDRANALAKRMGFKDQGQKVSEKIYQWRKDEALITTLEMDVATNNFTIRKNWREDQTLLKDKRLPAEDRAIVEAKNFLQAGGLSDKELEGNTNISYLRFIPPKLAPAVSLSEADFTRVNLFRNNLDELPVLPPHPEEALVSFLLSGSRESKKRILEVNYSFHPISQETFTSYTIKSSTQAWEELKAGQGFIANLEKGVKQIVVRKIYLAYFENSLPQEYLQPIYVFEGNNNFMAYIAAITPQWTE